MVGLCLLLSSAIVFAYFKESVSVTNHIAMGDVNIGIKEYQIKNGREVVYENEKVIFPGDVISKIPKIKNYASDCWIRAEISFEDNRSEIEGFTEKNLFGIDPEWELIGDYYYYKKILKTGDEVPLFQGVEIPREWNEVHAEQTLGIRIKAEAIQAANFIPDFSAMSPWGNQKIELCIHDEDGVISCVKEEMSLSVEFRGDAYKLLAVPDNFFHNIKRVMPGDVYEDKILLKNTTNRDAVLYFKTELPEQEDKKMEFLESIELSIFLEDRLIYSGNLKSTELQQEVSLGTFKKATEDTLYFQIKIPSELNNSYALRDGDVKWIFTVEGEETDSIITQEEDLNQKNAAKTGDDSPILWYFVILAAGVLLMAGIMHIKKKEENKHEK